MNNIGFSPRLPLTTNETHYDMIFDIIENIKQNFKNLLLTSPGERPMLPRFGVGVRKFLFENDKDAVYSDLSAKIYDQVSAWMPFITITEIFLSDKINNQPIDENTLGLVIKYEIPIFDIEDFLTVGI